MHKFIRFDNNEYNMKLNKLKASLQNYYIYITNILTADYHLIFEINNNLYYTLEYDDFYSVPLDYLIRELRLFYEKEFENV